MNIFFKHLGVLVFVCAGSSDGMLYFFVIHEETSCLNIFKLRNQTWVGRCLKTLKFVITIITWWLGHRRFHKKVKLASLQISDVHTFFCKNFDASLASQFLKQAKKSCFLFKQILVFFGKL